MRPLARVDELFVWRSLSLSLSLSLFLSLSLSVGGRGTENHVRLVVKEGENLELMGSRPILYDIECKLRQFYAVAYV
jgi:hypothetical protein